MMLGSNLTKSSAYLDGLIARRLTDPGKLIILRDRCIHEGMRAAQFDARVAVVRQLERTIGAKDRAALKRLERRH